MPKAHLTPACSCASSAILPQSAGCTPGTTYPVTPARRADVSTCPNRERSGSQSRWQWVSIRTTASSVCNLGWFGYTGCQTPWSCNMAIEQNPELSIIVPVLNEAEELPALFATLADQQGVSFEVILCEGGSSDGTQLHANQLAVTCPFQMHYLRTPRGRGCQMNAGAAVARSGILLFLHADSRFSEHGALASAVRAFRQQQATSAAP